MHMNDKGVIGGKMLIRVHATTPVNIKGKILAEIPQAGHGH